MLALCLPRKVQRFGRRMSKNTSGVISLHAKGRESEKGVVLPIIPASPLPLSLRPPGPGLAV